MHHQYWLHKIKITFVFYYKRRLEVAWSFFKFSSYVAFILTIFFSARLDRGRDRAELGSRLTAKACVFSLEAKREKKGAKLVDIHRSRVRNYRLLRKQLIIWIYCAESAEHVEIRHSGAKYYIKFLIKYENVLWYLEFIRSHFPH